MAKKQESKTTQIKSLEQIKATFAARRMPLPLVHVFIANELDNHLLEEGSKRLLSFRKSIPTPDIVAVVNSFLLKQYGDEHTVFVAFDTSEYAVRSECPHKLVFKDKQTAEIAYPAFELLWRELLVEQLK